MQQQPQRNEGSSKLLQVELLVAALIFIKGHWRLVQWPLPVPILVMSDGSAQCYWACMEFLLALTCLNHAARFFKRLLKIHMEDGDYAIAKYERNIDRYLQLVSPSHCSSKTGPCDTHAKSTAKSRSFSHLQDPIKGYHGTLPGVEWIGVQEGLQELCALATV